MTALMLEAVNRGKSDGEDERIDFVLDNSLARPSRSRRLSVPFTRMLKEVLSDQESLSNDRKRTVARAAAVGSLTTKQLLDEIHMLRYDALDVPNWVNGQGYTSNMTHAGLVPCVFSVDILGPEGETAKRLAEENDLTHFAMQYDYQADGQYYLPADFPLVLSFVVGVSADGLGNWTSFEPSMEVGLDPDV